MAKWSIYIAVLLVLTGCSKKNEHTSVTETEYALLLEHAGLAVLTRAGAENTALPQGTEIGLYAIDRETGAFNMGERRRNVFYRVMDDEGNILSSEPAILEKEHSYDIYAYAPIRTSGLEEHDDDAILTVRHGEDFLYAVPATLSGVAGNNRSVTLNFVHRMAQVQFFLVTDSELSEEYLKGAVFEVSGFYESARLSLSDGTLSVQPENGATIGSRPNVLQTVPTCIIPGTDAQLLTITLTTDKAGSKAQTYRFRFEQGKSYQFTIKYNVSLELEVESSVITWNEMNGGDINIGQ